MKEATKMRFVSDVNLDDKQVAVKKPFKLERDNQRRFIRLEISAPVSLRTIKDSVGGFFPNDDGVYYEGTILNISPGGVLVDLSQPVDEYDIVLMRFTLQETETLENVLGFVKRVERDEDMYLAGIEFVGRDFLQDKLSQGEIDLLTDSADDFEHRVQDVLSRYLYSEKPAEREI